MTIEDDDALLEILTHSKTVASVGVSSNPEKPSFERQSPALKAGPLVKRHLDVSKVEKVIDSFL